MTVGLDLISLSVCTTLSSSILAYNDSQSTQNPRDYYQFPADALKWPRNTTEGARGVLTQFECFHTMAFLESSSTTVVIARAMLYESAHSSC